MKNVSGIKLRNSTKQTAVLFDRIVSNEPMGQMGYNMANCNYEKT